MCAKLCVCMQVWDFATGEVLRTLEGHKATVNSVVISADGKYVISGAGSYRRRDNTVKVVMHCIVCVYFDAFAKLCTCM